MLAAEGLAYWRNASSTFAQFGSGGFHSDSPSDELSSERKRVCGVLLPAVAQSGQRRVPWVFELGESELVEDVVNSSSGRHLQQKQQIYEQEGTTILWKHLEIYS